MPVETGGQQIFAEVDLLLIDDDSDKKSITTKNTNQFKFLKNYW